MENKENNSDSAAANGNWRKQVPVFGSGFQTNCRLGYPKQ